MGLMMKSGLERMLNTEMDVHLGRRPGPGPEMASPGEPAVEAPLAESSKRSPNRRNVRSRKTVQGELGEVQLCIIHLVRAALRYVNTEDSKSVARDLKKIYQAATAVEAEAALEEFAQAWDQKYPTIAKQWRAKWADITTLFAFPAPIRKAIYTTNVIESVNSSIRKFTKNRKIYPNEASAL
jgi:transposase-like protein